MLNIQAIKQRYAFSNKVFIGLDKIRLSISMKKLDSSLSNIYGEEKMMKVESLYQLYKSQFYLQMRYLLYTAGCDFAIKKIHNSGKFKSVNTFRLLDKSTKAYVATIDCGMVYGKVFMAFTFNPCKQTPEMIAEFNKFLQTALWGGYSELYEDAVISHIEFYIDIYDCPTESLMLLSKGRHKLSYIEGSTYYGGSKSPLRCVMYDKGAEQEIERRITRIEARLTDRGLTFKQLVENGIKNPFALFLAVPQEKLVCATSKTDHPEEVALAIREKGLMGALNKDLPARKKIINELAPYIPPWWNAENLWAAFKEILLNFAPIEPSFKNEGFPAYRIFRHKEILECVLEDQSLICW